MDDNDDGQVVPPPGPGGPTANSASPESPGDIGGDDHSLFPISEGLREALGASSPGLFADAIFSPVVIGEILLRSLTGTTALLVPILLILLFGIWLIWKMRKEGDNEAELGSSHGGTS